VIALRSEDLTCRGVGESPDQPELLHCERGRSFSRGYGVQSVLQQSLVPSAIAKPAEVVRGLTAPGSSSSSSAARVARRVSLLLRCAWPRPISGHGVAADGAEFGEIDRLVRIGEAQFGLKNALPLGKGKLHALRRRCVRSGDGESNAGRKDTC